jgi:hypothetical protein
MERVKDRADLKSAWTRSRRFRRILSISTRRVAASRRSVAILSAVRCNPSFACGSAPFASNSLTTSVWLFTRPRLRFRLDGERTWETVAWLSPAGQTTADFIRVRIWNRGISTAEDAQVLLVSISRNGTVLERDASPLAWTDEPNRDNRYSSMQLPRGSELAPYVDVCGVDHGSGKFHVSSKKHTFGYHTFEIDGDYKIDLIARASGMTSKDRLSLTVRYRRAVECVVIGKASDHGWRLW